MTLEEAKNLKIGDAVILENITSRSASNGVDPDLLGDKFTILGIYLSYQKDTDKNFSVQHPIRGSWAVWYGDLAVRTEENKAEIQKKKIELEEKKKQMFQTITEITQSVYPETSEVTKEGNQAVVVLHFPEKTVRNNKGQKQVIYDVFFKIIFDLSQYKLLNIFGTRSTRSVLELQRDYVHSHISPTVPCEYAGVCFNSDTDLAINRQELQLKFDEVMYESVLYMLEDFLEHESIKGGPYSGGLSNLFQRNDNIVTPHDSIMSGIYAHYKQHTKTLPEVRINTSSDISNVEVLQSPDMEKELFRLLKEIFPEYIVRKTSTGITGISSRRTTELEYNDFYQRYKGKKIIFKGKEYPFKITKNDEEVIPETGNLIMHPNIQKYIVENLSKEIRKFYYEQYKSETVRA